MSGIRNQYKDSLFCKLFGEEVNKANLLSLYNALNNTDYLDTDIIEINTIDDVIYMSMKNECAQLRV